MMEDKEKTCCLDYETEYNRVCRLCEQMQCELKEMSDLREELKILKAQMEIAYLIFGENR